MPAIAAASLNLNLQATLNAAAGAGSSSWSAPLTGALANLIAGTGAGKCDSIWYSQRSLATASNETIDLHAPGNDALGNALSIVAVKTLIIQNLGKNDGNAAVEADSLTIGALGTTAQLTSLLTPNTSGLIIPGGGCFILTSPGAVGLLVGAAATNHSLKIATNGPDTTFYNIWIIGASA